MLYEVITESTKTPGDPGPARPPAESDQDLFDLGLVRDWIGFVLRAPLRHRRVAGAVFAGVVILAVVAYAMIPIRWQVQASILTQRSRITSYNVCYTKLLRSSPRWSRWL